VAASAPDATSSEAEIKRKHVGIIKEELIIFSCFLLLLHVSTRSSWQAIAANFKS